MESMYFYLAISILIYIEVNLAVSFNIRLAKIQDSKKKVKKTRKR